MGVDIRAYLPPHVRVNDVATVIGILSGLPKVKNDDENEWVRVQGVKVKTSMPEMCEIEMIAPPDMGKLVDGEKSHFVYCHFEHDGELDSDSGCEPQLWGTKLLSPPSTPFWCAVMKRVVTFFGGYLKFNDCEDGDFDLIVAYRANVAPRSGVPWRHFQACIRTLNPITEAEINAMRESGKYVTSSSHSP
jgi:hypothetical protein